MTDTTPALTTGLMSHSIGGRAALLDCAFLSLVVLLSLVLYVWRLGFSSDDWSFLAAFASAGDHSWLGLYRWMTADPQAAYRPLDMLYLTGLYELFGLNPLPYHLVNALAFVAMAVFFYLSLRELGLPRLVVVAVPAVFVLLPHYSTDRFWPAASSYTVSMVLYFLSFYACLRGLRSRAAAFWGWELLGLASLVCSALMREVALPLFLLNVVFVAYRGGLLSRRVTAAGQGPSRAALLLGVGANVLVLASLVGFKALTSLRTGGITGNYLLHVGKVAVGVTGISYGSLGLGLPFATLWLLGKYFDWLVAGASLMLLAVVYGYLRYVARRAGALPATRDWLRLTAVGVLAFGLGYLVFLTNDELSYSSTGIINRIYIAGTVGVGLSFAGICGWAASFLRERRRELQCFSLLVALICLCGFATNNTLGTFWAQATSAQNAVLDDVYQHVPTIPHGSTLILDGICPYVGPAVVFYAPWDLQGALRLHYQDWDLRADIAGADLQVDATGLTTVLYKVAYTRYPYSDRLVVYNSALKRTFPIPDAESAQRYFGMVDPEYSTRCPYSESGKGVQVLPWR